MKILALDTALAACSVAVWQDGRTLAREQRPMARGQAEALIPMVQAAMVAAGLTFAELDRIAVTVGPGSFTGIRVGLAGARGLGLALGKPVIGVTTLEVLAAMWPDRPVLAAIDARRGQVYARYFAPDIDTAPALLSLADASALAAVPGIGAGTGLGDGAPLLALPKDWRVVAETLPDPAALAALAAIRPVTERSPAPLYLRAPDATPARAS